MAESKDYYEILNSHSNASYDELKQSYRQLILQCHPDKLQHQHAEQLDQACDKITEHFANTAIDSDAAAITPSDKRFVLINEAWNTLKDPMKRKQYDAELLLTKFQLHSNVYAQITLADMECEIDEVDKDEETAECEVQHEGAGNATPTKTIISHYTYNCRCGGQYIVDDSALSEYFNNKSNDNDGGGVGAGTGSIGMNVVGKRNCDKNTDNVADGSTLVGNYKDVTEEVFVECSECSLVIILKPQAHK